MKKIVAISLMLISVLLINIVATSFSNFYKFIETIELSEEDNSTKNKTNSSNTNLVEEEEKHFSTTMCLDVFFIVISELKDRCFAEKIASVFIEIVTPPPIVK